MGGLLALETMTALLLAVPATQRALAFVIARETYDLKTFDENSKSYIMAEKRLNISRFLWRAVPWLELQALRTGKLIGDTFSQVPHTLLCYCCVVTYVIRER